MPDPAVAEIQTETPIPLGAVEDLATYRERRAKGDGGEPATDDSKAPDAAGANAAKPKDAAQAEAAPDASSDAGKELARKRGSLQSRLDEITAEKYATASERDAARAEVKALRDELTALKTPKADGAKEPKAEAAAGDDPKPDAKDFDDWEKYTEAAARWHARQEIKAERAKDAETQRSNSRAAAQRRVTDAGAEAHEDFDAVMAKYEAGGGTYSPAAIDVILGHPLGHEFAYALATQPEIAARINGAPNERIALLEAGEVLASLKAAKAEPKAEPKARVLSKAPAPVEIPASGEGAAGMPDPSTMSSVKEWRAKRALFMG